MVGGQRKSGTSTIEFGGGEIFCKRVWGRGDLFQKSWRKADFYQKSQEKMNLIPKELGEGEFLSIEPAEVGF